MNGAKALGIDNKYGSFEKGKKPGIVLIKKDHSEIFS
jgi:cytosine/adenosine deaminase-related metal-dependent hydrolase